MPKPLEQHVTSYCGDKQDKGRALTTTQADTLESTQREQLKWAKKKNTNGMLDNNTV